MDIQTELELLKHSVQELKEEVHSGFQVITKKIGELSEKLEDRRVQNGVQDVQIEHHDQLIEELHAKTEELEKNYHALSVELEKKDKIYVRWLVGLSISLIPLLVALVEHFRR